MLRIYDLGRPEAEPAKLPAAPAGIRSCNFVQNDNTIVCSYADKPGIGWVAWGTGQWAGSEGSMLGRTYVRTCYVAWH